MDMLFYTAVPPLRSEPPVLQESGQDYREYYRRRSDFRRSPQELPRLQVYTPLMIRQTRSRSFSEAGSGYLRRRYIPRHIGSVLSVPFLCAYHIPLYWIPKCHISADHSYTSAI